MIKLNTFKYLVVCLAVAGAAYAAVPVSTSLVTDAGKIQGVPVRKLTAADDGKVPVFVNASSAVKWRTPVVADNTLAVKFTNFTTTGRATDARVDYVQGQVNAMVGSLGSAAYANMTSFATKAQGEKADSALQATDVVDSLTSTDAAAPLSAKQGKVLQDGKLSTTDGRVVNERSILQYIPENLHAGIKNWSNTTDLLTYFQLALPVNAARLEINIPCGRYHISDSWRVVYGQISVKGADESCVQIVTTTDVPAIVVGTYDFTTDVDKAITSERIYNNSVSGVSVGTTAPNATSAGIELRATGYSNVFNVQAMLPGPSGGLTYYVHRDLLKVMAGTFHTSTNNLRSKDTRSTIFIDGNTNWATMATANHYNQTHGNNNSTAIIRMEGVSFGDTTISGVYGAGMQTASTTKAAVYMNATAPASTYNIGSAGNYVQNISVSNVDIDGTAIAGVMAEGTDASPANIQDLVVGEVVVGGGITDIARINGVSYPRFAAEGSSRPVIMDMMATAPVSQTDNYIPQWDGVDARKLKNGLAVVTSIGATGSDTSIPTEQAVREAITGIGSVGEANTVTNQGTGEGLAMTKVGADIPLKSIKAGTGITLDTTITGELSISAANGDVTAFAALTDAKIIVGDGGAKGVKTSIVGVDTSGNITTAGTLSAGTATTTTPQLTILGGSSGARVMEWKRTHVATSTWGVTLGGGSMSLQDGISGGTAVSLVSNSSGSAITVGSTSGTATTGRYGSIAGEKGTGIDAIGGALYLDGGLGTGIGSSSKVEIRVPDTKTAGTSTTQSVVSAVRVTSTGTRIEPGGVTANATVALDVVGSIKATGTITAKQFTETAYAPTGTTITLSLTNGTIQRVTTTAATTVNLPTLTAGQSLTLNVCQGATPYAVTWGGTVPEWANGTAYVVDQVANKCSKIILDNDGVETHAAGHGVF